jgi:hypothetical protein
MINSDIISGRNGGTMGGIPVNNQELRGVKIARTRANFQLSNILPSITGRNMGKKVEPSPKI